MSLPAHVIRTELMWMADTLRREIEATERRVERQKRELEILEAAYDALPLSSGSEPATVQAHERENENG